MPAFRRVRLGIAYTFQVTSIYQNLTVRDNVALAQGGGRGGHPVDRAIERVGLSGRSDQLAGTLAYGHQRLLEIAMGLALHPALLILDEPTQGLSDGEIDDFIALVRSIAEDATVLLIEHNMQVVMQLASRITVMDRGMILAEGTPEAIRADRAVPAGLSGERLMLEMANIACFYGQAQVLRDFSLTVQAGEVLCLLGRNGAGKTTALKAIMGLVPARAGTITLDGVALHRLPAHDVPRQGVGYVPQGRRLFSS